MKYAPLFLKQWLIVLCVTALCLVSCNTPPLSLTPTLETMPPTVAPSYPPLPTATTQPMPQLINLHLWIPDFLDPYTERLDAENPDTDSASVESIAVESVSPALLLEQFEAFNEIYPNVQVQIIIKKATGPGGLYSLFSTAYLAAPEVLPDLIVLNHTDLQSAIDDALIAPLENVGLISDDFFPFALESVTRGEQTYALPFLVQADQMVYRPGVSATPPFSWTDVLTKGYSLLFPAAPVDAYANDALLVAYLSAGGTLQDATGLVTLNSVALESVYQFFIDLLERSLINPERSLSLVDATACWETYQQGIGRLSPVPMGAYWVARPDVGLPGWMPTPNGNPVTLVHPWAVALVTLSPERREAALQLALWLTSPQPMGDVARSVPLMPARSLALDQWSLLSEDKVLVSYVLGNTRLPLPPASDLPIRRALQAGLQALLSREITTAEEAIAYAAANFHK